MGRPARVCALCSLTVDYKGRTRYRQTTIDWLSKFERGTTSPGISRIEKQRKPQTVLQLLAPDLRSAAWAFHPPGRRSKIPEIICFEKQNKWGGGITPGQRLDEHANPSGLYYAISGPKAKECLDLADTLREHSKACSTRPAQCCGIISRAALKKQGTEWVRFNSPVRSVMEQKKKKFQDHRQDRVKTDVHRRI